MLEPQLVDSPLAYLAREISNGSSILMMGPNSAVRMVSPVGIAPKKFGSRISPNDSSIRKFAYYVIENEKKGNTFFVRKSNGSLKRFILLPEGSESLKESAKVRQGGLKVKADTRSSLTKKC